MTARPWKSVRVAESVDRVPTMLSHEERQYLQWLSAERFEGWGAVVDLGPWLGSSTAALAAGLERRGGDGRVHSFDLFRWDPAYMERTTHHRLPAGADFLPLFRREVEPWSHRVEARRADLREASWEGGPIEILFVDAAKSWELLNAILATFGPALVPSRSRVVLQDFRHFSTYWLPLVFCGQPDRWRERESVEEGTTVTFSPLFELPEGGLERPDFSEESFSFAEAEALLQERIAAEAGVGRFFMQLTLTHVALLRRELSVFDRVRRTLFRSEPPVSEPPGLARAWAALAEGDLASARTLGEQSATRSQHVAEACLLLGRVAQETGLEPLSRDLFCRGLELCHEHPPRAPGWAAFDAGELERAQRLATRSLHDLGETAETLCLLGRIAQETGRFDDAEAAFSRALELDPSNEQSRRFRAMLSLGRGFAAFDAGHRERAAQLAGAALRDDEAIVDAHFLLGRVAQESGRFDDAAVAFSRALEIDPRDQQSRRFLAKLTLSRGFAAFDAGDLDVAERLVGSYVEAQGETAESHFLRGRIAQERGRRDAAKDSYSKALELDPQHRYSREFLARVCAAEGNDSSGSG